MLDDKYFESYFVGTNFGSTKYSDLILEGLLKVVCYYHNGHTMSNILIDNGLVELKGKKKTRVLTHKGATYLYRLLQQKKVV